jgi:excisionase family DNA binding protein
MTKILQKVRQSAKPVEEPEALMDTERASSYLRVHENTLYRFVQQEGLPHIRLTKRNLRFYKKDIDAWLEHRRQKAARGRNK